MLKSVCEQQSLADNGALKRLTLILAMANGRRNVFLAQSMARMSSPPVNAAPEDGDLHVKCTASCDKAE